MLRNDPYPFKIFIVSSRTTWRPHFPLYTVAFFFFFSRDMLRPVEEEDRLLCGSQETTTANLPFDDSQIFKESNAREKNRKFFLP